MKFRSGSFLHLAFTTLGEDAPAVLEDQYRRMGSSWMASYWGYIPAIITDGLKQLNIPIKPRGGHPNNGKLAQAFEEAGGIDNVVHVFRTSRKIAQHLGFAHTSVVKHLKTKGFIYDSHTRRWQRPTYRINIRRIHNQVTGSV